MITNEPGYHYVLETAEKEKAVDIYFCKNVDGKFIDGITNEEIVDLLIARLTFMVKRRPSQENMNALTHAQQTKQWIHVRAYSKNLNKKKNKISHASKGFGVQFQTESGQAGQ